MQIKMMGFEGNMLSSGIDMNDMVKLLKDLAKENPKGTMEDIKETIFVAWSPLVGPGTATIQRPGQPDEVIEVKPGLRKPTMLRLPTAAVVRLAPAQSRVNDTFMGGARFITSPNGEKFEQLPGAEGPAPTLSDPALEKAGSLEKAYTHWISNGEVGSSSKALAHSLCYSLNPSSIWDDKNSSSRHPIDWADFGRCVKMLDAIPQLRSNLSSMQWMSPAWALIYASFDRLEKLYRSSDPGCPRFGDAVIEALTPHEDRVMQIGLKSVELASASDGRTNDDIDEQKVKDMKNDLDRYIRLHRGAASFESSYRPAQSRKPASP